MEGSTVMNHIGKMLIAIVLLGVFGCSSQYANVPPDSIGMILTPTGYEKKIYGPSQVDIGDQTNSDMGNRLVLIQRSGIAPVEQFVSAEGSEDKEDHRCLTADHAPMTVDTRLLLALPDYETPEGQEDLQRIFHLGNPTVVTEANPQGRVLRVSAESVYAEQARLQVRGRIRQISAGFPDFDAAFASFSNPSEEGFTRQIERAVAEVLVERQVPLRIISAHVSNLKPDPSVIDAIAAEQAAKKRVAAIRTLTDFLSGDPTGARWRVYNMQVLQEIVRDGQCQRPQHDLHDRPQRERSPDRCASSAVGGCRKTRATTPGFISDPCVLFFWRGWRLNLSG
jgi:hypothetical protein